MAKTVALVNQKGGVAKTTTAVNLAACLAKDGKRILLMDIDPQGNATSGLGFNRKEIERCVYDVLINGVSAEEVTLATKYPQLSLVPATIQLAGAEVELVPDESRNTKLKQAIEPLAEKYDYIFLDCPPSLSLLTVNALTAADGLIVPVQCEYYAMEGLGQLMDTFNRVRESANPELRIEGVLLTMFDPRTSLSVQVVKEVRRHLGAAVFKTVIYRNVRLSEAPSHGKSIFGYDRRSRGAKQYQELAKEFLARQKNAGAK